ncbi:hypothetical protein CPC08DRAFT_730824 [Agrocybe pediades]|nr:hypothetical protein CPC08DRAFT_730824 [Agrocybe pediades]
MPRVGRPPSKFIFTSMQKLAFLDTLADFKAECEEVNPERKGRCSKVTEVKKRFAKELMEHEEFSDENLDTSEQSRAQWEAALVKRYANYDLRKIQNGNNSKKSSSKKKNEPLKAVTPFILFDDDISPREHFISKLDPDELREKFMEVKKTKGIPVCSARNQVISELWNAADQEKEAAELEVLKTKVDCNQKYFARRAMQSLEKMLSSGRLGSGALSLAWAFRDPNTNMVQAGRYYHIRPRSLLTEPSEVFEFLEVVKAGLVVKSDQLKQVSYSRRVKLLYYETPRLSTLDWAKVFTPIRRPLDAHA